MNNLVKFLSQFHFFILFLFLQIICFSIMFSDRGLSYQQSAFFSSINNAINWINEKKTNLTQYFELKYENDILMDENSRLLSQSDHSLRNIEGGFILKKDTLYNIQYKFQVAKVINGTLYQSNNYFTLNRGRENGIKEGMGVISNNGIVGKIAAVSDHYAIVESIIANSFTTSVVIPRTGHFGLLQWNGNPEETNLRDIVKNAPLEIGDQVYTREGSTIFPPNIPVGEIKDLTAPEGEQFYEITLNLNTDFASLSNVYVISNIYSDELKDLQSGFYFDE